MDVGFNVGNTAIYYQSIISNEHLPNGIKNLSFTFQPNPIPCRSLSVFSVYVVSSSVAVFVYAAVKLPAPDCIVPL